MTLTLITISLIAIAYFIWQWQRNKQAPTDGVTIETRLEALEITEPQLHTLATAAAPKLLTPATWFYDNHIIPVIEQIGYFVNQFYTARLVVREPQVIEVKIRNPALFNTVPLSVPRPEKFDVIVLAANNNGSTWYAEVFNQHRHILPVTPKRTSGAGEKFDQSFLMGQQVQVMMGPSRYCVGEIAPSLDHGEYLIVRITVQTTGANYVTRYGYYYTPMFQVGGAWVIP